MASIFINPVTASMVSRQTLEDRLAHCGHRRVFCENDWGAAVRRQYGELLKNADRTVADTRCPVAVSLAKSLPGGQQLLYAPIRPILLSCAAELSARKDLAGEDIIVTTPCRALVEMGEMLGLSRVRFVTAKSLLADIGCVPVKRLEASPIPLGYFRELGVKTVSVTGRDAIVNALEHLPGDARLLEMLYCAGGCHNGDGI